MNIGCIYSVGDDLYTPEELASTCRIQILARQEGKLLCGL